MEIALVGGCYTECALPIIIYTNTHKSSHEQHKKTPRKKQQIHNTLI